MQRCIFCKSTTNQFTTKEHILPESLGGGDWAILPSGLFCNECQNIFGSSIEQQALADYPFSFLRVFIGIPTKKRKAPWFNSWAGKITASVHPGQIGYEPTEIFKQATVDKQKSMMHLLAHPIKPHMVCRTLLKMGIEVVAADDPTAIFDLKYDDARRYALKGIKDGDWWYLQVEDMKAASKFISQGVSLKEWLENVKLEVFEIEDGAEIFHLQLLYLNLITPLDRRIQPPLQSDLFEPQERLFVV